MKNFHQLKEQRIYFDANSNGNGSLMRILPVVLLFNDEQTIFERFELVWEISALTHGHIRAALSCLIYLEFAYLLIKGSSKVSICLELIVDLLEENGQKLKK